MGDWRKDPRAYDEWARRNRVLIIVPAAPVVETNDPSKFNPHIWETPADIKPGADRGKSN